MRHRPFPRYDQRAGRQQEREQQREREREQDRHNETSVVERALQMGTGNRRHQGSARDATEPLRRAINGLKRVLLSRFVQPGNDILDLCCGQGADLPKFAHLRIRSYFGIDFAPSALDEARHRASTNTRFKRCVRELRFLQTDLRTNVVQLPQPVDIVTCMLALHYLVAEDFHLDNVLQTVRDSLRRGGQFLITMIDAAKIPAGGIHTHSFVRLSAPKALKTISTQEPEPLPCNSDGPGCEKKTSEGPQLKETCEEVANNPWVREAYTFRFPGLSGLDDEGLMECVIPLDRLVERCAKFSLILHTTIHLKDVRHEVEGFSPVPLSLRSEDEPVAGLYVCHAFRRQ
jgi:SAM-dependent methyltransferase